MKGKITITISSGDYDDEPLMRIQKTWRSETSAILPEPDIQYAFSKALRELRKDLEYKNKLGSV